MTHIITTINDLRQWVSDCANDIGVYGDEREEAVAYMTDRVSQDAHAAGLRYGENWTEYLNQYDLEPLVIAATTSAY